MNKILFLICLSLLPFSMCRGKATITINGKVVEKVPYTIEANGILLKVTFDDETSVMTRMDETIVRFDESTDIKGISLPEFYRIKGEVGEQLHIDGLNHGDELILYSANGNQILSARANGSSINLNLCGYSSGLYIARIKNKAIKFIKK